MRAKRRKPCSRCQRGSPARVSEPFGYSDFMSASDPVIRLLKDLVAIDSVNPALVPGAAGEAAIARALVAEYRRIGLATEVQEVAPGRPNVVGVLDGRAPGRSLMLCGHIDTVGVAGMARPFDPVERDGRVYGRGSQDMKSGVAAMIDAARVVIESGGLAAGRLIVAAVVDEEHESIGADALVTRWRADGGVVTEPTGLAVAVAHKGFEWVDGRDRGAGRARQPPRRRPRRDHADGACARRARSARQRTAARARSPDGRRRLAPCLADRRRARAEQLPGPVHAADRAPDDSWRTRRQRRPRSRGDSRSAARRRSRISSGQPRACSRAHRTKSIRGIHCRRRSCTRRRRPASPVRRLA